MASAEEQKYEAVCKDDIPETKSPASKEISEAASTKRTFNNITKALLLFILSFATVAAYSFYVNSSGEVTVRRGSSSSLETRIPQKNRIRYSLNCTIPEQPQTCPKSPLMEEEYRSPSSSTCPDYFQWIHEDLRPWRETGITKEMIERASKKAHFRLVIISGKAYVETYDKAFQTRDVFTLWGILQLLKRYPGKVPDLDLVFNCHDPPAILSRDYKETGPNAVAPPPLFHYCGSDDTLDIVFPDWSFWGWPEVNIKPWETLLKELNEGNKKVNWRDREPHAYWKGNPSTSWIRQDLMKCQVSKNEDWNARLYTQDWIAAKEKGYKESNLAEQCVYRYKIYIEGNAWSVSEKYILACDSPTLLVRPHFYDSFTRSLVPLQHYWPINPDDKCKSIKFAVDWGNRNKKKAHKIGQAANDFISKNVTMQYVYDYMFHVLNEYAKLLRFKPSIPEKAVEYCSETMACRANGLDKDFMMESMAKSPSDTEPCILPPMNAKDKQSFLERKAKIIQQVEKWQNKYYEGHH